MRPHVLFIGAACTFLLALIYPKPSSELFTASMVLMWMAFASISE